MEEKWAYIEGLNDKLLISSLGRIFKNGRELASFPNHGGYLYVFDLGHGGKRKKCYIHRAVLRAFVGPRPDGMVSRHLDGNNQNNRLSNLTYGTHKENMADRKKHGKPGPRGTKQHLSKLNEQSVLEIKRELEKGVGLSHLARAYSVSTGAITAIRDGKSWGWLKVSDG